MFTLCLDLHLRFVPPMSKHAPGIVLTRTIQLPFPPYSGLAIYGVELDDCPDPMGMHLQDVVWDLDRCVFLAHTVIISDDEPLAFIPDTIRGWIARGWALGSYYNAYPSDLQETDEVDAIDHDHFERMETLHTLPKSRRDREFNRLFKALIREMSEGYNNLATAYAMDKLGRLLADENPHSGKPLSETGRLWIDTCREFDQLDHEAQTAWQDKVAKYPSLEKVLSSKQATRNI